MGCKCNSKLTTLGKANKLEAKAHTLMAESKGLALSALFNEAIEGFIDDDSDRNTVIGDASESSDIPVDTINEILAGDLDCPAMDKLEALAEALDVPFDSIQAAREEDGCTEDNNEEEE